MNSRLPICVISFNRSLYLESLLHSLESEMSKCDVIVCDNGSTEKRMSELLKGWSNRITNIHLPGGDWINDEYKAKNALLKHVLANYTTETILFLQDDMQYIGPRGSLQNIACELSATPFMNIAVSGVRRSTVRNNISDVKIDGVWKTRDNHIGTTGIFKRSLFESVGVYSDSYPTEKEYWGRGEDDYHARTIKAIGNRTSLLSGFAHVPIFLGIWNDPRGGYSFLRGGKRYGHYVASSGPLYYSHMTQEEYIAHQNASNPRSFVDVARPIGWNFAMDKDGDQYKYPQSSIMIEGPVSDVI